MMCVLTIHCTLRLQISLIYYLVLLDSSKALDRVKYVKVSCTFSDQNVNKYVYESII